MTAHFGRLSALMVAAACSWETAVAGIEVQATRLLTGRGFGVAQALRVGSNGEFVILGDTSEVGFETAGLPLDEAGCFIARFTSNLQLRYFRYINGASNCGNAVVQTEGLSIWLTATPYGPHYGRIEHTFDLAPEFSYRPITTQYLLRLAIEDGRLISTTRFPTEWYGVIANTVSSRMVVDSKGGLWIGGYAAGPFPDTPDAAFPVTFVPGFTTVGTLMRLSPEGDRIIYATHVGGRAVAALAIDADDNVYTAGLSIHKLSPTGQILWTATLPATAGLTMTVNAESGVFIGGCTIFLTGFPATPNAFQSQTDDVTIRTERFPPYYPNRPCVDGFVARFRFNGELVYSTLIGGLGKDFVNTIVADDEGTATVSGTVEGQPNRFKDLYWVPRTFNRDFIARIGPDGTSASFFTNFPMNGFGWPTVPISMPNGELGFVRIESKSDSVGNIDIGPSLYVVREVPSVSPRIDGVTVRGNLVDGYWFEIKGDGFGEHPEVVLDGRVLAVVPPVSAGGAIVTLVFAMSPPRDEALQEQTIATYRLSIRTACAESRPVLVTLVYR